MIPTGAIAMQDFDDLKVHSPGPVRAVARTKKSSRVYVEKIPYYKHIDLSSFIHIYL